MSTHACSVTVTHSSVIDVYMCLCAGVYGHYGHDDIFHPYTTRYDESHRVRSSPDATAVMSDSSISSSPVRDQPSGATRNNISTAIAPREYRPAVIEDEMGRPIRGYPAPTHYSTTFTPPPLSRDVPLLSQTIYQHRPTHAVVLPLMSDDAAAAPYPRFSTSGYASNEKYAYLDASTRNRRMLNSHYKQTFVRDHSQGDVPVLNDGSVLAHSKQDTGYVRNSDILPSVHATNAGADRTQSWAPVTHSVAISQTVANAPRAGIPQRPLARAGADTSQRRIEDSAFTRAEKGPPAIGIGTEHIKLRLGATEASRKQYVTSRSVV